MSILFDCLVSILFMILFSGGIPWHDKLLLKHGADLRRTIVIFVIFGLLSSPFFKKSFLLKGVRKFLEILKRSSARWKILGFVTLWAIFIGIFQTLALRYTLYDVGIFHQILWNLAHFHGFQSTVSQAGNFMLDHFSPSLALLTPSYWIFGSSPLILSILQPLLIFGGVAAWLYLAENIPGLGTKKKNQIATVTLLSGLSFDSLWGNLRWGFHESSIYFFTMSWVLSLTFTRSSYWLRFSLLLIAAGTKETALLNCALVFTLFSVLEEKKYRWPSIFSALILFLVFIGFELTPHPENKNYFIRYYSYLGSNLKDFFENLFFHPEKILETIGARELLGYFKTLFLPWVFLPFFTGKYRLIWILAALPSILSAALSTYAPLRQPGLHYVLEIWPVLATMTLLALTHLPENLFWKKLPWIWAVCILLMMDQDPFRQMIEYGKEAYARTELRNLLDKIPQNASVIADERIGQWISGRSQLIRWQDIHAGQCAEWVLVHESENLEKMGKCPRWLKKWTLNGWSGYTQH